MRKSRFYLQEEEEEEEMQAIYSQAKIIKLHK